MDKSIAEYRHEASNLYNREQEVLERVSRETGFEMEKVVFHGTIYDPKNLGSIIVRGHFAGEPAVLKIESLSCTRNEKENVDLFNRCATSTLLRLPEIKRFQPYQEHEGFGFMISEWVEGAPLFEPPWASAQEKSEYARVYQDYREHVVHNPWWPQRAHETESAVFIESRLQAWRALCEEKDRVSRDVWEKRLHIFQKRIRHEPPLAMVFSHGHLTARDVKRDLTRNGFVLFSNLWWSYRPCYYDLAFNVWSCINSMDSIDVTVERAIDEVEEWLKVYRTIPWVQSQKDFERGIKFMIQERMLGTLLADASHSAYDEDSAAQARRAELVKLAGGIFDYYSSASG